ncbi:hypothetical protein KOR34_17730 [Posidoniimonas corsicana]|uniref:Uncharacterized protein n=1 Tax=Posidoniimonas corsicana TaxID=1938618 RepID=A0A5C5VDZ0_9BACT|nr:hypothetical protein KOR34_17730 [Posidoniimonas corsicana]
MSKSDCDDYIGFSLCGSEVVVGDLVNEPAVYHVSSDLSGRCRLPATAINAAATDEAGAFAVDGGCFFIASRRAYDDLKCIASDGSFITTPERVEIERDHVGEDFGFVIAGQVDSLAFTGDGIYKLDISQLAGCASSLNGDPTDKSSRSVLQKALRMMGTLVCTSCFQSECMEHPDLGRAPRDAQSKQRWVLIMAAHATNQGWRGTPEPSAFGGFSIRCPKCSRS